MKLKRVTALLLIIAAIRMLWGLGLHYGALASGGDGFHILGVGGGDDGRYYYAVALRVADGSQPAYTLDKMVWPYLMGWWMSATGLRDIVWFKLINISLAIMTVGLVLRVAQRWSTYMSPGWPGRWRLPTGFILLVGLYPSSILFTSGLSRDAWIYFFHFVAVYYGLRVLDTRGVAAAVGNIGISAVAAFVLFTFRWYAALAVVLGLGFWVVQQSFTRAGRGRSMMRGMAIACLLAGGVYLLAKGTAPFRKYALSPENIIEQRGVGGGGSGVSIDFRDRGALLPAAYLYSFINNALGPLPWHISNLPTALALLGESPLLWAVAIGVWRRRRLMEFQGWYWFWQAVAWFALITIFNDNYGTALRLRVPAWHCMFMLYSTLLIREKLTRQSREEARRPAYHAEEVRGHGTLSKKGA